MSFFNEIFKEIGISNLSENLSFSVVFGKACYVFGDYKILALTESEIVVMIKKKSYKIYGENLKIKTMSKGELLVEGKVDGAIKNG